MTDLNETFYELLERYNTGIEPLENWTTENLLDLQVVIRAELEARDRRVQNEYFDDQAEDDGFWIDDDERMWPTEFDSYGGTDSE